MGWTTSEWKKYRRKTQFANLIVIVIAAILFGFGGRWVMTSGLVLLVVPGYFYGRHLARQFERSAEPSVNQSDLWASVVSFGWWLIIVLGICVFALFSVDAISTGYSPLGILILAPLMILMNYLYMKRIRRFVSSLDTSEEAYVGS